MFLIGRDEVTSQREAVAVAPSVVTVTPEPTTPLWLVTVPAIRAKLTYENAGRQRKSNGKRATQQLHGTFRPRTLTALTWETSWQN